MPARAKIWAGILARPVVDLQAVVSHIRFQIPPGPAPMMATTGLEDACIDPVWHNLLRGSKALLVLCFQKRRYLAHRLDVARIVERDARRDRRAVATLARGGVLA